MFSFGVVKTVISKKKKVKLFFHGLEEKSYIKTIVH